MANAIELTMTENELATLLENLRMAARMSKSQMARVLAVDRRVIRQREQGVGLEAAASVLRQIEATGHVLRVAKLRRTSLGYEHSRPENVFSRVRQQGGEKPVADEHDVCPDELGEEGVGQEVPGCVAI